MHTDDQYLALWRRWWLNTERRSEQTLDHYLRELRRLQNAVDQPLVELDRLTVEDWIGQRLDSSPHNGRFAYRATRSFYRWALASELVDVDPTDKIPAPREVKNPTPTTVTVDMVETILASIGTTHPATSATGRSSRCCSERPTPRGTVARRVAAP